MSTSTLHLGIFYMPQIYDMGPTALLPLRRKACWGFFSPLKNPTASAGFEPANLGTKGQHATPRPPKPINYHNDEKYILSFFSGYEVEHYYVGTIFLTLSAREMYRNKSDSESSRNSDTSNKTHRTVLKNGGCSQGIPIVTATNFLLNMLLHTEMLVAEHPVYIIFKRVNKKMFHRMHNATVPVCVNISCRNYSTHK